MVSPASKRKSAEQIKKKQTNKKQENKLFPCKGYSLWASSPGAHWQRGGKKKDSLQQRLWNLIYTSNSSVAPRGLSCQISANQQEAKTSANVKKHWKTLAKVNDVINNVISASAFASTFSMQLFKFQRRSCKLSFLFPPRRQSAPESTPRAIRDIASFPSLQTNSSWGRRQRHSRWKKKWTFWSYLSKNKFKWMNEIEDLRKTYVKVISSCTLNGYYW